MYSLKCACVSHFSSTMMTIYDYFRRNKELFKDQDSIRIHIIEDTFSKNHIGSAHASFFYSYAIELMSQMLQKPISIIHFFNFEFKRATLQFGESNRWKQQLFNLEQYRKLLLHEKPSLVLVSEFDPDCTECAKEYFQLLKLLRGKHLQSVPCILSVFSRLRMKLYLDTLSELQYYIQSDQVDDYKNPFTGVAGLAAIQVELEEFLSPNAYLFELKPMGEVKKRKYNAAFASWLSLMKLA